MSKVQLAGNANGTGIFTIASPNSNTDRTLTLPDNTGTVVTTGSTAAVTQAMLAVGVVGNGPAFSAWKSVSQTISAATFTKVTLDSEEFDTNSCFNTSTSVFTPNVAGYYQFNWNLDCGGVTTTAALGTVYKNGTQVKRSSGVFVASINEQYVSGAALIYMNGTTDYAELYAYIAASSSPLVYGGSAIQSFFQAVLVRAA